MYFPLAARRPIRYQDVCGPLQLKRAPAPGAVERSGELRCLTLGQTCTVEELSVTMPRGEPDRTLSAAAEHPAGK